MRVDPVSGEVLAGPFEPVYVYEAPVRFWHWVMMVAMFVLAGTGYLIGSPPPAIGGEATDSAQAAIRLAGSFTNALEGLGASRSALRYSRSASAQWPSSMATNPAAW